VFAYLLTRANAEFQDYYLAASKKTLERWAAILRLGPFHGGRQR
jgi:hypothetical protein